VFPETLKWSGSKASRSDTDRKDTDEEEEEAVAEPVTASAEGKDSCDGEGDGRCLELDAIDGTVDDG
jgi:hypothetical protein